MESASELVEEEEELVEYFLDLLEAFLDDFLERLDDFLSSLFLSLVEEGLESSREGDLDLLERFADFFLSFGILVWKFRGPPEICIAAAGSVIKAGSTF